MSMHFSDIARQAAADGLITSDEIMALRRGGWGDGRISPEEADAIFAINDGLTDRTSDWCDFFVEAIGEYVLNASQPKGYVTEEQAAWLIARVWKDGRIDSLVELELLVRVLERAANTPDTLKAFVLQEIERAVLTGSGPTRDGGQLSAASVTEAECRVLRRVIFSVGGDRPGAVGRAEADMLFRIKDATLNAANAPEWQRLFVQGLGNYLMGYASPDAQLSRERASELDAFLSDARPSVGRFIARMAGGAPNGFDFLFGRKQAGTSREEQAAEAELVDPDEKTWLDGHVDADGKIDSYERALLRFIAEDASDD
jgi:hypothetical protein